MSHGLELASGCVMNCEMLHIGSPAATKLSFFIQRGQSRPAQYHRKQPPVWITDGILFNLLNRTRRWRGRNVIAAAFESVRNCHVRDLNKPRFFLHGLPPGISTNLLLTRSMRGNRRTPKLLLLAMTLLGRSLLVARICVLMAGNTSLSPCCVKCYFIPMPGRIKEAHSRDAWCS